MPNHTAGKDPTPVSLITTQEGLRVQAWTHCSYSPLSLNLDFPDAITSFKHRHGECLLKSCIIKCKLAEISENEDINCRKILGKEIMHGNAGEKQRTKS